MQHLTHITPGSTGASDGVFGFPSHSDHRGFTNSKTLEDLYTDEFPIINPDSEDLLDDQLLPFLWNDVSIIRC